MVRCDDDGDDDDGDNDDDDGDDDGVDDSDSDDGDNDDDDYDDDVKVKVKQVVSEVMINTITIISTVFTGAE